MSAVVEDLVSRVEHPVVAPPFVPVLVDDDEIQFRIGPGSSPVVSLADGDGDGKLGSLLRRLAAGDHVRDVLQAFAADDRREIARILHELLDEEVLRDQSELAGRPSLDSYVSVQPLSEGEDIEPHLADRILLISVGNTGRLLASDLLDVGFENLAVWEPFETDGWSPGGVEHVELDDQSGRDEIRRADCLVLATDGPAPELHRTVNDWAFETGTRWISGRIQGFQGFVGPAVVPGRTACHECFRARYLANTDDRSAYRAYERTAEGRRALPPFSRVVAGYLTLDLLQLLVNDTGFTADAVLCFDFFEMSVESNTVLKLPRCDTCGTVGERTLDWQRFVTMEQQTRGG